MHAGKASAAEQTHSRCGYNGSTGTESITRLVIGNRDDNELVILGQRANGQRGHKHWLNFHLHRVDGVPSVGAAMVPQQQFLFIEAVSRCSLAHNPVKFLMWLPERGG